MHCCRAGLPPSHLGLSEPCGIPLETPQMGTGWSLEIHLHSMFLPQRKTRRQRFPDILKGRLCRVQRVRSQSGCRRRSALRVHWWPHTTTHILEANTAGFRFPSLVVYRSSSTIASNFSGPWARLLGPPCFSKEAELHTCIFSPPSKCLFALYLGQPSRFHLHLPDEFWFLFGSLLLSFSMLLSYRR